MLFRLGLGKENLTILVTSLELYLAFDQFTQFKEQKKKNNLLLLWTKVGFRVGYRKEKKNFEPRHDDNCNISPCIEKQRLRVRVSLISLCLYLDKRREAQENTSMRMRPKTVVLLYSST